MRASTAVLSVCMHAHTRHARVQEYHDIMVEVAVEQSDEWIEKYLEGEEPDAETLRALIRKGTINMDFFPMICGSAFKNKGVQPMLDAVVDYMPAPTDVADINGVAVDDPEKKMTRKSSVDEPFSALAFKIATDPFLGSLTFIRVYSGVCPHLANAKTTTAHLLPAALHLHGARSSGGRCPTSPEHNLS
jgi:translation elongation factor EF-G